MLDVPPTPAAAAGAFPPPLPPPPLNDHAPNTIPGSPSPAAMLAAAARPHEAPEDDDDVSLDSLGTAFDEHEALRQLTNTPAAALLEPAAAAACASTFPLPPLPSSLSTMPTTRSSSSPACSADQTFWQLEIRLIAKHMAKQSGTAATGKNCWFILGADWHRPGRGKV